MKKKYSKLTKTTKTNHIYPNQVQEYNIISAANYNSLLKLTQDRQGAIGRDFIHQNQVHAHLHQPHRTIFLYLQSN